MIDGRCKSCGRKRTDTERLDWIQTEQLEIVTRKTPQGFKSFAVTLSQLEIRLGREIKFKTSVRYAIDVAIENQQMIGSRHT